MQQRPRDTNTFSLADAVLWSPVAKNHRKDLGEGWLVAEELARLHLYGLQRISRAAMPKPSEQEEAIITLGCLGLNLYVETLALTIQGLFDVASHLLRGLSDCQSLTFAAGSDEQLAKRFLKDKLKASQARKAYVAYLRAAGEDELADKMNDRYKKEAGAANSLAHVSTVHIGKIMEVGDDVITPVLLGRSDSRQCRLYWLAAVDPEHNLLTWLHAFRDTSLGSDWIEKFEDVTTRFRQWFATEAKEAP